MVSRTRPYSYSVRLSKKEKELLDKKITSSGLNNTEFLIRVLKNKPIVYIEKGSEILQELKRQGNNLNQLVKHSYMRSIVERDVLLLIEECKKTYDYLCKMLGGE